MNYSKWDNLADSDDEKATVSQQEISQTLNLQDELQHWLRRQIIWTEEELWKKGRAAWGEATRKSHMDGTAPPELDSFAAKTRKLTDEERKALAMFLVVNHFDAGETNLDRHAKLLDLVRHNRWLEEPDTLEILCQLHMSDMRKSGKAGTDDETQQKYRAMVLTGINSIASAKQAKLPGGLLEMITTICTPATDSARQMREKWQKKEYARDALMDSMFPELRRSAEEGDKGGDSWADYLVFAGFFLMLIALIVLMIYMPEGGFSWLIGKRSGNATSNATEYYYGYGYYYQDQLNYSEYYADYSSYHGYYYYDDKAARGLAAGKAEEL